MAIDNKEYKTLMTDLELVTEDGQKIGVINLWKNQVEDDFSSAHLLKLIQDGKIFVEMKSTEAKKKLDINAM